VDALNKKKVPILAELCDAGIEVYVLRRPAYIKRMREELERHGIKVPKTDKYDAVLLAFTPPRKWALVDSRFLRAWEAMVEWRNAKMNYQVLLQRDKANKSEKPNGDEKDEELRRIKELIHAKLGEVKRLLEEVQMLEAKLFVRKIQMLYPEVDFDKDFEEFGIEDDNIAQAYYCEAFLEAMNCDWLAGYLVKSGIGVTGSPPPKQRKKMYIYDGRLKHVLNQLTIKVYHLNIYDENDRKKIKPKARKLAEKIWKRARRIKKKIEGGRVGEALGRPLSKREGSSDDILVLRDEASCLRRSMDGIPPAPIQGPKHPAVLITLQPSTNPPFSPLILTSSPRLWAPLINGPLLEVSQIGGWVETDLLFAFIVFAGIGFPTFHLTLQRTLYLTLVVPDEESTPVTSTFPTSSVLETWVPPQGMALIPSMTTTLYLGRSGRRERLKAPFTTDGSSSLRTHKA
jgi:hypothetical protein